MKVLVVGNGGREHAIVWSLLKSPKVEKVYCAPGNGGIQKDAECVDITATDIEGLVHFAKETKVDLTVVGPEVPLLSGIVDRFEEERLAIFGPRREAARIEGSKRFAKEFMKKYGIPTADFQSFTESSKAIEYIREKGAPIVIKADGLAAGKGVVVASTLEEAEKAVIKAMEEKVFGDAGQEIVIEEFLSGQEMSLMAFMDGKTVKPMVVAQDHKPVFDHDQGPNTGGMGAYSPVPQIPDEVVRDAVETILLPMQKAFKEEGIEYKGVLYAGLMITASGPKVIEFNARFGDPEAQVVLPRLENDLIEVITAVMEGRNMELRWSEEAVIGVVLAAKGYPGAYERGAVICGWDQLGEKTLLFHAGTKKENNTLYTNGGRVLLVAAKGETLKQAQQTVYKQISYITCDQLFYRRDIGNKAIERASGAHRQTQGR